MENIQLKIFRDIDLFDFKSKYLAWTFLIFLPTVHYERTIVQKSNWEEWINQFFEVLFEGFHRN